MNISDLKAPFPPDRISWRVGATNKDKTKGMALAYIDSRDVQDRLDQVCGAAGWQCRYPHAAQKTVCEIGIKIADEWIWKADGAGDSDVEAEKGALSDAFKRCAVKWGIGRYLYDVASPWVEIEAYGKSYKIKESEYIKLRRALPGISAPDDDAPRIPDHVLAYCDAIDKCDTLEALDTYGRTTLAAEITGLISDHQGVVRGHFAARRKALQQAEGLAA